MICAFTESKTTVRDDDDEEGRGDEEREGEMAAVDHIKPFRDYYLQAETSTEALVNIRLVLLSWQCSRCTYSCKGSIRRTVF